MDQSPVSIDFKLTTNGNVSSTSKSNQIRSPSHQTETLQVEEESGRSSLLNKDISEFYERPCLSRDGLRIARQAPAKEELSLTIQKRLPIEQKNEKTIELELSSAEDTVEVSDAFNKYLDEKLEDEFILPSPTTIANKTETSFLRQQNRSSMLLGGNYESFAETTLGQIKPTNWH